MGRKRWIMVALVALVGTATYPTAAGASVHGDETPRVLVQYRGARSILAQQVRPGESVDRAVARYHADPAVDYAEPDVIVRVDAPNDPFYPGNAATSTDQWGLDNTGQQGGVADSDVDAPEAWALAGFPATGPWPDEGYSVGVIDTGIDSSHPDLAGRIAPGCKQAGPVPGVLVSGCPSQHKHGTHVAGIIAAVGNNGMGGSGVAPGARVAVCGALAADGSGFISDVAACIDDFVGRRAELDLRAINLSLGSAEPSETGRRALDRASAAGVLVFSAAGNDGGTAVEYPAAYSSAVAVGATDRSDNRAVFSNQGPELELVGPGVSILSTVPGGSYEVSGGTSMSTPFAAGVAAYTSWVTGDRGEALRARLVASADDLGAPGRDNNFGYGRVNLCRAIGGGCGPVARPANDQFTAGAIISGPSGSIAGTTVRSSIEPGEPQPSPLTGSVWYRWTAPATASVTVSTSGSGIDTTLMASSGASVGSQTVLATNDDASSGVPTSSITFNVSAGSLYHLAVGVRYNSVGPFELQWSQAGSAATTTTTVPSTTTSTSTTSTSTTTTTTAAPDSGGQSSDTSGSPPSPGYRMVASDGGIFVFGSAPFFGSTGSIRLAEPIAAMAATPSGKGYWMVARDGGVFAFGDAAFFGSAVGRAGGSPVVAFVATRSGSGYWIVTAGGALIGFGDAPALGTVAAGRPIVGAAPTPSGGGVWLVGNDGGVFALGDAGFFGSTGALRLNRPIVGLATTPSGRGYWLVADDGGIFAFGDAVFRGSTGAIRLNRPVVAMAPTRQGAGYWLVASDGGIFAFGDAAFLGSTGSLTLNRPVVGMTTT